MAFDFTSAQKKVLDARGHNVLVSAAAGSGKTAVLVERIVRLISEGDHPLDIDRLLVVTFTRAAAAQMRERIGLALAAKLRENPGNTHLQRQEVLLHNAQITTIDSFCAYLLRNYFSEIDLDPGFRQIEETESSLLAAEVLGEFLEEKYAEKDPGFLACADYFSPGRDDRELERLLLDLVRRSGSHPSPETWLRDRAGDYDVPDEETLFAMPWMQSVVTRLADLLLESEGRYQAMKNLCLQPGGPDVCYAFLEEERENLFGGLLDLLETIRREKQELDPGIPEGLSAGRARELWEEIRRSLNLAFARYPNLGAKKYSYIDQDLRQAVKAMRDAEKGAIDNLRKKFGGHSVDLILAMMDAVREPVRTLSGLAVEFRARLQQVKKDRHVIDFVDLEHFALDILAQRREDGSYESRRTADALRNHFAEILIDEYQDSNEVQEVLLQIISGEEEGHYNRFMVGDIKQSIYRFRLARPEIFMEKYASWLPDDPDRELIELDQNFRSRSEVLDCVNALFPAMMRNEVGGVEYTEKVSLKKGAVFPDEENRREETSDLYKAEFLLLETSSDPGEEAGSVRQEPDEEAGGEGGSFGGEEADTVSLSSQISEMTARQKEALLIACRIREIVGRLPVRDEETGEMRPARYRDIVVLLRATREWNEDLRAVFEHEGIPAYAESRTGYFAAEEIRQVIALLRVLDNPRQDIPLYGVLRGYFGNFSQEEIAQIRLLNRDGLLFDALSLAAQDNEKAAAFLLFLKRWRLRAQYCNVSEIVTGLLEETGYQDYCLAQPGGTQRAANLRLLRSQADSFTKTDYTGLFQFLRYIDGMNRQAIDLGEANILDENADVVRIMSIHKSKGLEFPICFVAGLSKGFAFRHFDASGNVVFDGDWGLGIRYFDASSRVRATTLRREEIAAKILRDSLGEELRVLYVAMTRAKEKLILTASIKGVADTVMKWKTSLSGLYLQSGTSALSPGMIGNASSYAELILKSVLLLLGPDADPVGGSEQEPGQEGIKGIPLFSEPAMQGLPLSISLINESDLTMQAAEDQLDLSRSEEILRGMEGRSIEDQPDRAAARKLADSIFFVYPHEELSQLQAQTSVSEIKHRAMNAWRTLQAREEGNPESAEEMFPEVTPVPYAPSFIKKEEEEEGQGARRGTAFHRVMELLDYADLDRLASLGLNDLKNRILALAETNKMTQEDADLVSPARLHRFLCDPLAARMAAAHAAGTLHREQPFVLGIPADQIRALGMVSSNIDEKREPGAKALREEIVTVQGIIDAFFIENGEIILVDYKTDRVRTADELAGRYRTQLDLYARALQQALGLPVREKLLYSTALGETVSL